MAASAGARPARRGPAPIASFDHDGSDESSPDAKPAAARLPDIREGPAGALVPPAEPRARSHSTPAAGALAPAAPRIDISRASSSSHHDSRDSSPELALFAGGERAHLDLGFREDGALDLRSSTEELTFLEPAVEPAPRPAPPPPSAPAAAAPPSRRHSRKDSQGSEAALLGVSGRTSRLSSVGSQCSAQSAVSRVSRLSVVSGASRSPSPHRMLLETSFCGPKPIEADPEIGAGALVDRILGLAEVAPPAPPAPLAPPVDARDRREVRTEATVESARAPLTPSVTVVAPPAPTPTLGAAAGGERRARARIRREPSEPEVYKPRNKAKDVIIIKLRPGDSYEEEEEAARKPDSLELAHAARPAAPAPPSPSPSRRRSPSPAPAAVSRKSSFCSLFKSRETIASPESPSDALRRKRSLTEGRERSKSRERAHTPSSGGKQRGSVLSLFRTPRRSAASGSGGEREVSPAGGAAPAPAPRPDRLKYYEDNKEGIIHIPLRTPPDERPRRSSGAEPAPPAEGAREPRPASAPQPRAMPERAEPRPPSKPVHRTVLPDGSIIIPLHSPTERQPAAEFPAAERPRSPPRAPPLEEPTPAAAPADAAVDVGSVARAEERAPAEGSSGTNTSPASKEAGEPATPEPGGGAEGAEGEARRRRKERLVFTTHVGSREQVFSTQFSITKTPSVTSEISGSFPSFEGEPPPLRDSHIAERAPSPPAPPAPPAPAAREPARDSSESEPSSEAAPDCVANDVEKRVLVVQQESFEEELPYVPTTLPQERSVALPMVPVRERGGVLVSSTQRPRATAPPARPPPPPPAPAPPEADKLRIKLPRRARPASAASATRARARSGSEADGRSPAGPKAEWIDFSEVPERRKQPKRIQTLPAAAAGGVLFSYVEPEQCRCECHAHPPAAADHEPLLAEAGSRLSSSSAEGEAEVAPAGPAGAGAGRAS